MDFRLAQPDDCFRIAWLYHMVYEGKYGLPLMKDLGLMQKFLQQPGNYWVVAEEDGAIVGSVVHTVHPDRYAKVFGAVVDPRVRGRSLSLELARRGYEIMQEHSPVDFVYVLTRTVHEAAQIVIERLGYKKLGVFPNVHKGDSFETHCLAALYSEHALNRRKVDYQIHHRVKTLADIACQELGIPCLEATFPANSSRQLTPTPLLEFLDAPAFARARHRLLGREGRLLFEFHSLNDANGMLTSADQSVEVFVNLTRDSGHCEILGAKVPGDVSYSSLLLHVSQILRDHGARYVEMGIEAARPKIVDSVLRAKFVPAAFFPAFGLAETQRLDYIVLCRTFENFDFESLQFRGLNQRYLAEYFNLWKEISLTPGMLGEK